MGYRKDDGGWHDPCLDRLKHGEPFFVLRAQDTWASVLVWMWAMLAQQTGCGEKKIGNARMTARAMEEWSPRKYPD